MKKITFALLISLISLSVFAQETWRSDPMHSKLGFTVTHLGITDVTGYFDKFDVTVKASKADLSDAVITLNADVNSINTAVAPRDKHLRSADFFEVEKYPAMTFKSTAIKRTGKNTYKLKGDLTLHGVTRPVTVDMKFRGIAKNPAANNAEAAGIQITGSIKRSDFGIGEKFAEPMISDEVSIKADGEFGRSK